MKLADLVDALGLEVRSAHESLHREVQGGYASDLLSDVLANAREGDVWITLQIHLNIVAVAIMKDIIAIILVGGREPEEETVQRAQAEGIPMMVGKLPAFELIGRLHRLGVRGADVKTTKELAPC